MVTCGTVISTQHYAVFLRCEVISQHNFVLTSESQNSSCVFTIGFCSLKHWRHTDAAADYNRFFARIEQFKAVAQWSHHIQKVALLGIGKNLGAFAADVKQNTDGTCLLVHLTDGNWSAQSKSLHTDMNKLTCFGQSRNFRTLDGKVTHTARTNFYNAVSSL